MGLHFIDNHELHVLVPSISFDATPEEVRRLIVELQRVYELWHRGCVVDRGSEAGTGSDY
ncbi:hypothetical protein [Allokutzneria sp. NRRL B-24872]|uniref:hypothetical protein n=1 Tax=Allokutzneria sp. NRRL B-24872 TaxID=1137961 RepID=UPI000A3B9422|nr:hypothetical protein [Allokutzneria sp. NRRL B-24872]